MHLLLKGQGPQSLALLRYTFTLVTKAGDNLFFKWQMNATAAAIAIVLFIINKAFSACFVLSKVGYVAFNIIIFQSLQCLTAAVACIGKYFFYFQVFFF